LLGGWYGKSQAAKRQSGRLAAIFLIDEMAIARMNGHGQRRLPILGERHAQIGRFKL